ncbi:MAG: FeoA domain-containing protein [Planctomycetota bacterium]
MIAPLSIFEPADGPLRVVEVVGDDSVSHRLRELGMGSGSTVSIVRPGRPAIVEIGGPRYALGSELLERVLVQPVGLVS